MKQRHVPVRTCRSCRKKAPKSVLQRFVVEQGQLVEMEQDGGYGLYCCPNSICREKMMQKLQKQKIISANTIRGRE